MGIPIAVAVEIEKNAQTFQEESKAFGHSLITPKATDIYVLNKKSNHISLEVVFDH